MKLPLHLSLAAEAATSLNLRFELLDTFSGQLGCISTDSRQVLVRDRQYFCNSYTAVTLAKDKAFTAMMLAQHGIACPEGDYFFREDWPEWERKGIPEARQYARNTGFPLFFKPLDGSLGENAGLIHSQQALESAIKSMSSCYNGFLLQQVVAGQEHRLFILDGEPVFAYRKEVPVIYGTGDKSLSELLKDGGWLIKPKAALQYQEYLLSQYSGLDYTPEEGEPVLLAANANPNRGGQVADFQQQFSSECRLWCRKLARITGLKVMGLDLFAPSSLADSPDSWTVIEINANPFLSTLEIIGKRELAIDIWRSVLINHFLHAGQESASEISDMSRVQLELVV